MGIRLKGNIKTKTTKQSGDFLVRFFDYDGTILKEQWVYSGETATAPTTPTHEYLTFYEWNNSLTNIDCHLDIGAIYNTIDNNTYIFIELTVVSTLNVSLTLTKNSTSLATVDWGDNTTSTTTTSGLQIINKTYSTYGSYIIKVSNLLGGYCYLGCQYGAGTYGIFGSNYNITTKVYFGDTTNGSLIGYQLFRSYKNINYVSLPPSFTSGALMFQESTIQHINLPTNSIIQQNMLLTSYTCHTMTMNKLKGAYSSANAIISNSYLLKYPNATATYVSSASNFLIKKVKPYGNPVRVESFVNNYSLTTVDFPPSITGVTASAFIGCIALKNIIFRSVIPPSAGTTMFPSINVLAKIYVPDDSVNDYKTATNWNVYENYIYPLSTYIP